MLSEASRHKNSKLEDSPNKHREMTDGRQLARVARNDTEFASRGKERDVRVSRRRCGDLGGAVRDDREAEPNPDDPSSGEISLAALPLCLAHHSSQVLADAQLRFFVVEPVKRREPFNIGICDAVIHPVLRILV